MSTPAEEVTNSIAQTDPVPAPTPAKEPKSPTPSAAQASSSAPEKSAAKPASETPAPSVDLKDLTIEVNDNGADFNDKDGNTIYRVLKHPVFHQGNLAKLGFRRVPGVIRSETGERFVAFYSKELGENTPSEGGAISDLVLPKLKK